MILSVVFAVYLSLNGALAGIGCDSVPLLDEDAILNSLSLSVTCGLHNITVQIDACVLERMGYNPELDISVNGLRATDPYTGGKICSLQENMDGTIFTMTLENFEDCSTQADTSCEGVINYFNVVRNVGFSNVNEDVIVRRRNVHLPFSCTYQTSFKEDLLPPLDVEANEVQLEVEHSGEFVGTLVLCVDYDCHGGNFDIGVYVPVWDTVCLIIHIPYPFKVQIIKIWATPDDNPYSYYQHVLVDETEQGCVDVLDPLVLDMATNTETFAYVSFPMFYWEFDKTAPVYFHAKFDICDEEIEACPSPMCGSSPHFRRRRDSHEEARQPQSVTIGPYVPNTPP